MGYPKGTTVTQWGLYKENQKGTQRFIVRRWVSIPGQKPRLERLAIDQYDSIREDQLELKQLILRLNKQIPNEQKSRKIVEIKHAFISPQLLDDYKRFLRAQIPSQKRAVYEYSLLHRYFLNFFINTQNQPDPLVWHKIHKTQWAEYLSGPESPASESAKRWIVASSNRFIKWLHTQRPNEVPPLKFEPLSKAKYKELEAIREMKGEIHNPKYINNKDWLTIKKNLVSEIRSTILIAYHFGLRRSETLGLKLNDIRKGHLSIERQLEFFTNQKPLYSPLKGREMRKVPYWDIKPQETYDLIDSLVLMHPDTLTDLWNELMDLLNLKYTIHDIRHTWITRMIRDYTPRDVQLAAGHKNITTTMGYLHDDRGLKDELFIPKTNVS